MGVHLRGVTQLLRKRSTKAEIKLWKCLRNRQFLGLKFIRQYPITFQVNGVSKFFVADFYCASVKLTIEIDGLIHDSQLKKDIERDAIIASKGIKTIRFTNREIEKDFLQVLEKLKQQVLHVSVAPSLE